MSMGLSMESVVISYSTGSGMEWNPCLLCLLQWQVDSLPLRHLGRPFFFSCKYIEIIFFNGVDPLRNSF